MPYPHQGAAAARLAAAIYDEIASPLFRARASACGCCGDYGSHRPRDDRPRGRVAVPSASTPALRGEDLDATLEGLLGAARAAARGRARPARRHWYSTSSRRSLKSSRGLLKLMRSVFQEQPEVAHLYLGSRRGT